MLIEMPIIIYADSITGYMLAIEEFIYNCSEEILPKNVDREQLVANIEALRNLKTRLKWLRKIESKGLDGVVAKPLSCRMYNKIGD